ncbi:MAG: glycosyltransferase family 2 protein [Cyclobacteriaceae bacterium]|jgi:hypothetical protein|nr:glycosyltransferase family 2 protein [Cyclobacteriaceae bacterium]
MTRTAVVILNFNGEHFLRAFLPAVVAHSPDATLVVADNGSTDGSQRLVREQFPTITLLDLGQNWGFCEGYNRALAQVAADYYVLLNSDVEVTPGWLAPLINWLDGNPNTAAVQPKIKAQRQKTHFEYAGAAGGFVDVLGYPFCRGRIFSHLEEDAGQYDQPRPVFWASGACMLVRASVFHALGGLDKDYFAHMEEIDLCWKVRRSGFEVWCLPESTVFHVGGGTLAAGSSRKTYLNFRNGLSLLYKHAPPPDLWWKIALRLMLDWVAALSFVRTGWAHTAAVFRAHYHFVKSFPRERAKRRALAATPYAVTEMYGGSVVRDYYLNGTQRFSELPKARFSSPK